MNEKLREVLAHIKTQKDAQVDIPGFRGELEPHQKVAVAFGVLAKRVILADFVGAGKTVEAIAIDQKLRSLGQVYRTLVVCQSGKRFDWRDEYAQFTNLPTYVVEGTKQQRVDIWLAAKTEMAVTIAGYETVRGDFMEKVEVPARGRKKYLWQPSALLSYMSWDIIILDEVSIFKNSESALSQALLAVTLYAKPTSILGLSATPIQKKLEDLHSVMEKIEPSLLGPKHEFMMHHCLEQKFTTFRSGRPQNFYKVVGYKNEEQIAHKMIPYFIRREKHEVYADKLKHVTKLRRVQLTAEQAKAYKEVVSGAAEGEGRANLFAKFQNMERICDTMAFFDKSNHASAKIDDLRFLLTNELQDEKVVIFSKYHVPLEEVESQILQPEGIRYIRYTGKEDIKDREAARHRFLEDPSIKVALMTTAGEMGYNMHSAHYMVFLNHLYNPQRIQQIIGRIDRPIVQKSNFICTIHYVAEGTYEEKIIPRLHKEADLMKKVFNATNLFDNLKSEFVDTLSADQLLSLIKTGDLNVTQTDFAKQVNG